MKNSTADFELTSELYIDGECVKYFQVRAGQDCEVIGLCTSPFTVRPFKFQDVELVGMATSLAQIFTLICRRPGCGRCPYGT